VAARISRGIEQQARAAAQIARTWVERFTDLEGEEADRSAQLLGQMVVGLAQAGARALLAEPDVWTPEALGEKLGRMAWAARGAI